MQALKQAQSRRYLAWSFFAFGCSVYQPELLSDQDGAALGGAGSRSVDDGGTTSTAGGGTGSAGASGAQGGGAGASQGGVLLGDGGVGLGGGAGEAATPGGAAGTAEGGALACEAETTAQFCKRLGKDCDNVDGLDNCGNAVKQAHCGACQGFGRCGGAGQKNVCGALTSGGVATASSVGSIGEDGSKAFDGSVSTKWFSGDGNKLGWIAYQFPGTSSHVVTQYSITSANDVPARDPLAWQLQGSNNGATWVTLDQRSAESFAGRQQTNSYTAMSSGSYRWYRLFITANNGGNELQLAEFVLYGS